MLKKDSLLVEIGRLYLQKRLPRSAAALAFSLTMAVFPLLLCLGLLLGRYGNVAETLRGLLAGLLPQAGEQLLEGYLRAASGARTDGLFWAAAAMLLMSSSAAFRSMENTMADVYGAERAPGLGHVPLSFLYSLLFFAGLYLSCGMMLVGRHALTVLSVRLGTTVFSDVWFFIRFPVLFLLLYATLRGAYAVTAPSGETRARCGTGAVAAAAALVIVSAVFSWCVGASTRYELVYGSLASFVALMTWFYVSSLIIVTGGAVNAAVARRLRE